MKADGGVIGVCVCTAMRPQMLRRCLESLMVQELPAGWRFEICVIENDVEPRSRSTVEEVAAASPVPIHYHQEPRRGIPIARNKTIEVALAKAYDWMALIDDDETARAGWLAALVGAVRDHGADVANGPVFRIYHAPLPDWWTPLKPVTSATGTALREAPTNNTLLSTRLVASNGLGLRFDEALTFGYEDIDFFSRAHARGAKIIWAAEAAVDEEIPETRISSWRLLSRVEMQASSLAFATKLRRGWLKAWLKYGVRGVRRLVAGALLTVPAGLVWLVDRKRGTRMLFRAASRCLKGWGHLRGLTKFAPDYYKTIDGY